MHSFYDQKDYLLKTGLFILLLFVCFEIPTARAAETIDIADLVNQLVSRDNLWEPSQHRVSLYSSYDRNGSDEDGTGFIRQEDDWYVIAEQNSPGAITRIWSANPTGNIRIILDDSETPLFEASFKELFSGKIDPFLKPFVHSVSSNQGPHWSYMPIPFQQSCKVLIDELCYYQIEMLETADSQTVETLSLPLSKNVTQRIKKAGQQFQSPKSVPFQLTDTLQEYKINQTIPAGRNIVMATFAGPAILQGLRVQWENNKPETGRDLYVTIYWDNEKYPSISAPLFDFFGSGIQTRMTGKDKSNRHYNFYPMPFEKEAKIVIANDAESANTKVNMSFFVEKDVHFDIPPYYFHAEWKRDAETEVEIPDFSTPTKPLVNVNQNYVALTTQAIEGHLVGLSILRTPSPESDSMIFLENFGTSQGLFGTGDYGLFDLAKPLSDHFFALSGGQTIQQSNEVLIRHFLNAPLPFKQKLVVTTEHGHANTKNLDISSIVYWYQFNTQSHFEPPLPQGMREFRKVALSQPIIPISEGEEEQEQVSHHFENVENFDLEPLGGIYETQDMMPYGIEWNENKQLKFESAQGSGSLQINLSQMEYSGYYYLNAMMTTSMDGSIISFMLNDNLLFQPLDLYSNEYQKKELKAGHSVFLHASESPKAILHIEGKNNKSTGYTIGIDTVQLTPTQLNPTRLELRGPFSIERTDNFPLRMYINSLDGDRIPLGFAPQEDAPTDPIKVELENGELSFSDLLETDVLEEALYLITWDLEIENPGIYRFEISPIESTPFLLQEMNQNLEIKYEKIFVNDIVVTGDKTLRYDSESGSLAPMRFKVPLNSGNNRLSWMIKADRETAIKPFLFGVRP